MKIRKNRKRYYKMKSKFRNLKQPRLIESSFQCASCGLTLPKVKSNFNFIVEICPACKSPAPDKTPYWVKHMERYTYIPPQPGSASEISGTKYIYLEKHAYADTWINGDAPVPINLASTYLSDKREGTGTPDENLIHDSPVDLHSLPIKFNGSSIRNFLFLHNTINGVVAPNIYNGNLYREDGLILCLSTKLSEDIQKRLGKSICVAIDDLASLKESLDQQIGVKSTAAKCQYTNDHRRNHFLKSEADSWMEEYRLFWPVSNSTSVVIPKGTARLCKPA